MRRLVARVNGVAAVDEFVPDVKEVLWLVLRTVSDTMLQHVRPLLTSDPP